MSLTPDNPVVGGVILRRPAIQSPNFVSGSSGWTINIDGSAEFNDLTIRGTFFGTDFIVNSIGLFFYSGTPANGNLIMSIVPGPGGTDSFGNTYEGESLAVYSGAASALLGLISSDPRIVLATGNSDESSAAAIYSLIATSSPVQIAMALFSPKLNTGNKDSVQYDLFSGTSDGVGFAGHNFYYVDNSGNPTLIAHGTNTGFNIMMGIMHAQQPGQSVPTAESWHNIPLNTGWSAGKDDNGNTYTPQYAMWPDGTVRLRGVLLTPSSGTVVNVVFATLPSGYQNTNSNPASFPLVNAAGANSGRIILKSTGGLLLEGSFGTGFSIPLDGVSLAI